MRFLHIFTILLALAPLPLPAKPPANLSWGKAGVSLDRYAADATECADTSRQVAVTIKPATVRQLDALGGAQLLDILMQTSAAPDANPMAMTSAITKFHTAQDIARRTNTFGAKYVAVARTDVADELQAALDACLSERGYVRIRLDDAQMKTLSKFKRHSAGRTAYLHALDSDPAIIARQQIVIAGR